MKNKISFLLNGTLHVVSDANPTDLLIDYLRSSGTGLTGTKLSCGEGGCGACTVLWSYIDFDTDRIIEIPTNACLRPICSLDGTAITTIEGLQTRDNLIQTQMQACSASQCGYCTPGFEMNMYALLKSKMNLTHQVVEDSFGGNLCRCTGYVSILNAMHKIIDTDENTRKTFLLINQLFGKDYFQRPEEILIKNETHSWYRPVSLPDLLNYLSTHRKEQDQFKLVKGNTSMGIYKRQVEDPNLLIDISQLSELKGIDLNTERLRVGAAETLAALRDFIFTIPDLESRFEMRGLKALHSHIGMIAGEQVRNTASVAGNLMLVKNHKRKGKPFPSDLFTVLCTLGAWIEQVELDGTSSKFELIDWVSLDKSTSVLIAIHIPLTKENEYVQTYKVARRTQNAHALINGGFRFELNSSNRIIQSKMVFGGVARVAFDLPDVQKEIINKFSAVDDSNLKIVQALLYDALQERLADLDLDDVSADYRLALGLNFLYKFYSYLSLQRQIPEFADHATGIRYLRPLSAGSHDNLIAPYYQPEENDLHTIFSTKALKRHDRDLFEISKVPDTIIETDTKRKNLAVAFSEKVLEKSFPTKIDAKGQTNGQAKYTHDLFGPDETLQAWYVISERRFANFDFPGGLASFLLKLKESFPDVHFISVADIQPNYLKENIDIYNPEPAKSIFYDPVFANKTVTCYGQPIGLAVAPSLERAKKAAAFIQTQIIYNELTPVITIEEAIAANSTLSQPSDISHIARPLKDRPDDEIWLEKPFEEAGTKLITGKLNTGTQYHFYMEPQGALAIPGEEGEIELYCSSQHLAKCQEKLGGLLGLKFNHIKIGVTKVGGGFGGKELRQVYISTAAGIAANLLRKPVRLLLNRQLDMQMIGSRHPFHGEFWVAANPVTNRIERFKIDYKLDGGHSLDCTIPVMELALLHGENTYDIEVYKATGKAYKTNVQSRTAFRSFGLIQAILIVEEAIEKTAHELGVPAEIIRENNFYKDGQWGVKPYPITPYGQELPHCRINQVWRDFKIKTSFDERKKAVTEFNGANKFRKRGISMIPLKYGISYTARTSNQGSAYLFVYKGDGTIILHHGGVEIGQGLHTKMAQLAADSLGLDIGLIKVADSDTTKIPNASSTGASTGSDLNGYAVVEAAKILRKRIEQFCKDFIATPENFPDVKKDSIPFIQAWETKWREGWVKIVAAVYASRGNLSAQYTYASPSLGKLQLTDQSGNKVPYPQVVPAESRLFYYYNYCAAVSEVEIDVLTGQFEIIRSDIVYDAGDTLNDNIDYGQVEGGFIQGVGYLTTEEMLYEKGGKVITDGTWTYKPPCSKSIPQQFNVYLLKYVSTGIKTDAPKDTYGINSSKSTGEPPLVLANTVYFAIKQAIMSFRKENGKNEWIQLDAPATVEKIQRACFQS